MNSILQTSQKKPSNFREFAASITPQQAKNQVEQMVQTGQISPQQLEKAQGIASMLIGKRF